MRQPVMEGTAHGLRCDAPGCGWKDMRITREEYPEYRNAPCPDCGENILTDADYKALLRIEAVVRFVNRWLWWLPQGKQVPYDVSTDGTGKVTMKKVVV